MPQTPTYGFWFEQRGDEPGHSLRANAGPSGNDILAEQVAAELSRIDSDVAGIDGRLTTVEGFGTPSWVQIASGSESNVATFVISSIPTGEFRAVRLHLFGENETTVDPIRIRFNSDNTTALHKSGYVTKDATGTVQFSNFEDSEFWFVATWGTANGCSAEVTIYNTHVSEACAFLGRGSRPASTAAGHQFTDSWGRLNEVRLLDSLRVSGPAGANFSVQWWLEGAPA